MDSSHIGSARPAAARLAVGAALMGAGALMAAAWWLGWWATLFGTASVAALLLVSATRIGVRKPLPGTTLPPGPGNFDYPPLRSLFDQVPVPLVRIDPDGARAINRAARSLFDTGDRIIPVPPALVNRGTARLNMEGRRWRIDAVDTAAGHRFAALIDVEAEMRIAERRASDEMIEILGHELLNGLSPIVSLVDSAIVAAARNDVALPDILATLARRSEGLEGFTRAYRTLSRLPDPVLKPELMSDLFADLVKLFAGRYGDAVELHDHVAPDAVAKVDRDHLTQALWAVLQNAAEAAAAAPGPPRVEFSATVGARTLAIRIADTGAGIPFPDRQRIFRPFYTTKPDGSGVGLSLARRIALAHGGDLRLLPVMPTTFELQLMSH